MTKTSTFLSLTLINVMASPIAEVRRGTWHGWLGPNRGLLLGVRDIVSIPFEDVINVLDLSHRQMPRLTYIHMKLKFIDDCQVSIDPCLKNACNGNLINLSVISH